MGDQLAPTLLTSRSDKRKFDLILSGDGDGDPNHYYIGVIKDKREQKCYLVAALEYVNSENDPDKGRQLKINHGLKWYTRLKLNHMFKGRCSAKKLSIYNVEITNGELEGLHAWCLDAFQNSIDKNGGSWRTKAIADLARYNEAEATLPWSCCRECDGRGRGVFMNFECSGLPIECPFCDGKGCTKTRPNSKRAELSQRLARGQRPPS